MLLIRALVAASISSWIRVVCALSADDQPQAPIAVLDPYPGKPRITFNTNGTFKITVFSDLHFGENPWDAWGPQQDVNSTRLIRKVLAQEKPDYVVLNGDLVTGENTFKENSTKLIDEIVTPLNEYGVKFSSTHGNHDNQANITHLEEIQRELQVAPVYSYTRSAPAGVGGEEGPGNYWVPVYATVPDPSPCLILWFFDSRGGKGNGTTLVPDWVDDSVAEWIATESAAMDAAWGPANNTRGALAFVHIPPHAIQSLQAELNSTDEPGLNVDVLGAGSTQASTVPETSGSDDAFWNALNTHVNNLHAVISGHDHGNEWCKRDPGKNVIFCFNKHSGYGGYSSPEWGHGVRNIVFPSSAPDAALDTWIRLEDGQTRARVTLNSNYQ